MSIHWCLVAELKLYECNISKIKKVLAFLSRVRTQYTVHTHARTGKARAISYRYPTERSSILSGGQSVCRYDMASK